MRRQYANDQTYYPQRNNKREPKKSTITQSENKGCRQSNLLPFGKNEFINRRCIYRTQYNCAQINVCPNTIHQKVNDFKLK